MVLGQHLHDDGVVEALVSRPMHRSEGAHPDDVVEEVAAHALSSHDQHHSSYRVIGRHDESQSSERRFAATSARPREICALTVPTLRPSCAAISA